MREMQSPLGGYYASLDADSEGEEGRFYVWTPAEVVALLDPEEYRVVRADVSVSTVRPTSRANGICMSSPRPRSWKRPPGSRRERSANCCSARATSCWPHVKNACAPGAMKRS